MIVFPFLFARQSRAPVRLQESGDTPSEGKSIRIARAFLVTEGSEGSDRK